MKRVGLVSFMHESNSFNPLPTVRELFQSAGLLFGNDILREWSGSHHEIGGMIEEAPKEMHTQARLWRDGWIGAVIYAILTEASLEFIGLGDPNITTWGTILYWAQNNAALLTGAWWTFVPPGLCIALVGFGLTMINFGIDEITNPRLRSQ